MEALRLIRMERAGSKLVTTEISPEMAGEIPQLALIGGFRKYST
jgi:hypothetical protein